MIEEGVTIGTPVEDHGLETTTGSAEGVDVSVAVEGMRVGVEVSVAEDAVVGGSTGVDILVVEETAAGDVVDTTEVFPPRVLDTELL